MKAALGDKAGGCQYRQARADGPKEKTRSSAKAALPVVASSTASTRTGFGLLWVKLRTALPLNRGQQWGG